MLRRSSTRKLFSRHLASLHHAQTTPTTACSSSSCFSSSLEQHKQQRSVGGKNSIRRHWKTPTDEDDVFFTFPPTKGRRFLSNNAFEDDALEKRGRFFTRDDADPHVQRRWKSTKASSSSSSSAKEGNQFEAFLYLFEQKSKSKPTLFSVHVETEIVSDTVRDYLGGV